MKKRYKFLPENFSKMRVRRNEMTNEKE